MKWVKFIIGNPASGKTTLRKHFEHTLCHCVTSNASYIDDKVHIHDVNELKNISDLEHSALVKVAYEDTIFHVQRDVNIIIETTWKSYFENSWAEKLKARGYFVEVYGILPHIEDEKSRNALRNDRFKAPDTSFVTYETNNFTYSKSVDYYQFIHDIERVINSDDLYHEVRFYKTGNDLYPKKILTKGNTGLLELDVNAIHFSSTVEGASLYYPENPVFRCYPLNKVYKYGKIFYTDRVLIGELYSQARGGK